MEGGQAAFLSQGLAHCNDNFICRHTIRAFINTAAAEQTPGHGLTGLVIQLDIVLEKVFDQRNLAARNRSFPSEYGEGRAI